MTSASTGRSGYPTSTPESPARTSTSTKTPPTHHGSSPPSTTTNTLVYPPGDS